jgi:hypothetical protein
MAYMRAFPEFIAKGAQNTSNNFDSNSAKGIPHYELTFQTPKAFLGLEEKYFTPYNTGCPSRIIGDSAFSKFQPTQ